MKKLIFFLLILANSVSSQTIQRFYIDFGTNDKTNGNATLSPDINGNYWNNITSSSTNYALYNSENKLSQFIFIVNAPLSFNGILNGGLLTPDKDKLGDLAIPTATQDYIYSTTPARITVRNLNGNNGYRFYFFASREVATTRKTNFNIYGMKSYSGTLQTSGANLGGTGKNMNNSTVYVTDTIRPDINGEIKIDMIPGVGGYAYLNAMKFEGIDITDITSMEIKGSNIYIPNDSSQMSLNIKPDNASPKPITWSIDDSTKATILSSGLLIAKKNGDVQVTATIIQNGSPMSTSTHVSINNQLSGSDALQKLFIDFGPRDITNGNITTNPSRKGNYWNNLTPNLSQLALVNSANQNTGFTISSLSSSTIGFSGILNGGLLTPDTLLLGEMAVATATQDYIFTVSSGQFKISGLNKSKGYRFVLFGSRESSGTRKSLYTLSGMNSCSGILQTSGLDLGGRGINCNTSQFYKSELVLPDNNGEIAVKLTASANSPAHLNMMKIEEFEIVSPSSLTINANNITEPYSNTTKMGITFIPQNATPLNTQWAISDTSIATISPKGVINAKQNGKITITASCQLPNGQLISDSKEITISNQITDIYVDGDALNKNSYQNKQSEAVVMHKAFGQTGISKGIFELTTNLKSTGSLYFYGAKSETNTIIFGEDDTKGFLKIDGKGIIPSINGDAYIRVNLINKTFEIIPIDTTKVTLIGSSVQYGVGATNFHGWFYQFSQILNQKYLSNNGGSWNTSNVSISGNNTVNLLDRWETDLLNEGSKYVIIGVSLGNEGIVGNGQLIFDQYRKNLGILISKSRSEGKIPILTNCYGRNDYSLSEYNYTKQMDLIIHQLDVPSINLLGALDNGAGGCPTQYMYDTMHPNDTGHSELAYTVVPSLFDALRNKKKTPIKIANTYLTMGSNTTERLAFIPDNTIHSFTTSFDIKTTSAGIISTFSQTDSTGLLRINSSGTLSYVSPNGGTITSSQIVNDGNWHKITLSHYYAWGMTFLYTDTLAAGSLSEKVLAQTFIINNKKAPATIDYRDWMFFRAAMNSDEIVELNHGKLLKSSLELYAPLDGLSILSTDTLINLALSMNRIKRIDTPTGIFNTSTPKIKIFPNPATTKLTFDNIDLQHEYTYRIYGLDGKLIVNDTRLVKNELTVAQLQPSKYLIILSNKLNNQTSKFEFQKK